MTIQNYHKAANIQIDNTYLEALKANHIYTGLTLSPSVRSTLFRDILHNKITVCLGKLYTKKDGIDIYYSKKPVDSAGIALLYIMDIVCTDKKGTIYFTKNGEKIIKAITKEFGQK